MKKSIIAVGVIVALGAGWAVAEWQTGKALENNKEAYAVMANKQMASVLAAMATQDPNLGHMMPQLNLTLESYDRGVLSSTAKYYLSEPATKNKEKIYFTVKIEHGPFPLSELTSFNLAPKGAVVNVEMDNTELTKPIFEVTKGKSPFLLKIVPGANSSRGELSITPIDYQGAKLDDIKLEVLSQNDMSKIEWSGKVGTFNIDTPEATLKLDSLAFSGDFKQGKFVNYVGNQNLKIKSMAFKTKKSYPPVPEVRFENTSTSNVIKEDTANVQYTFNIEFGSLKMADNDFGTIKFGADLSKLDGASVKKLIEEFSQHAAELENDPDLMQEIVMDNLDGILKASPVIKFAPISWSNKGGTSNYAATIELNNTSIAELETLPDDQIIGKVIKNIDSDLSISIPMLKNMVVTAIEAAGMGSKADAEKQFDQSITQLPALIKQYDKNNMLVVNNDKIESKFNFSNNVVTLNGKKMSPEEFIDSLE